MSAPGDQDCLSSSGRRLQDEIVERYEQAWGQDNQPTIEELLPADEPLRTAVLIELVHADLEHRLRAGRPTRVEDYLERFPALQEDKAVLEEFIQAEYQLRLENEPDLLPNEYRVRFRDLLRPQRLEGGIHTRCPHCHNPIELVDDSSLKDILCPSCGSSFSLISTAATVTHGPRTSSIAHFELLERLGMGHFGTVWKARDRQLDRTVAIKIPRSDQLGEAETEQFFREARAAAQLKHPHIVSVHEVGREGESIYIVSDYVRGANLQEWLTGRQLTHREAAALCVTLAEALDHAHEAGVIHRDVKPSNIMMDLEGQPYIMDFGLAKREVGEITMTVDGRILGTPAYMSPEQAKGKGHHADRRTDVYSLGVILYELLTGELPFRGATQALLVQIEIDEPPSPRKLNASIPRDLETICLKCLEKDPHRRYQTAQDLADDLQRWLNCEPITARPVGRIERGWRWCKRNPAVTALLATIAFAAAISSLLALREVDARHKAQQARSETEGYLRMVMNAIDELLTNVGEESLADVPHMEDVRKSLLQKALAFYEQLLEFDASDHALQLEFARAQDRVGAILMLLGDHNAAQAAFEQAIRRCQVLLEADPADSQAQHNLAMSLTNLGELFRKTSPEKAQEYYARALQIQQSLHRSATTRPDYRRELSRTLNNSGLLFTETGRYTAAESKLRHAITHLQQLRRDENQRKDRADLARSQLNLGDALQRQADRLPEAAAAFRDAISNLESLVEHHPEVREDQYRLAIAMLNLGGLFIKVPDDSDAFPLSPDQRRKDAVYWTRRAQTKLAEICTSFPRFPLYRLELAKSHNSLANALLKLPAFEEARAEFDNAHRILDELERDFPDFVVNLADYESTRGVVFGCLGAVEGAINHDPEAARPLVERAIQHQRRASEIAPENLSFLTKLSGHYAYLATVLRDLGHQQQSDEMQRKAADVKAEAALRQPNKRETD